MSNENTMRPSKEGNKDDPSAPFKVGNKEFMGLDATTTDKLKADPGLHNASGTSEQRSGEDLKLPEATGQGFTKEKTASESLIDNIEKGV